MRFLSSEEVIALGGRFGIEVDDGEADSIRDRVNETLDGLDGLYALPVTEGADDVDERAWREPGDDPHKAVSTACHVPPTTDDGLLSGTTVGVKDIIAVANVPMQCASAVMQGFVPGFDAAVVERLRAAGATITAKTNCNEFASGADGTTVYDGPITNPHDPGRTAGGSSGGSAAAVASGQVDVALGTDTGGSVRIPSAFCGIVGLKPTYGLVPLHGVVENAHTQDHVGPMTATVEEAARVLEAIAGKDERDPASLQAAGRDEYRVGGYVEAVRDPPALDELTIGVLEEGFGDGVASGVTDRTEEVVDGLDDAGASTERVSIPLFEDAIAIWSPISHAQLAAHWRASGAAYRREGIVDEGYQTALASRKSRSGELSSYYKARLLAGAQLIDAHGGRHYTRAQMARRALQGAFDDALFDVDALLLPTVPDVAPPIGAADDPGFGYGRNTLAADAARHPAITIPNGRDEGLPVGLQLIGERFGDDRLLAIAARIESSIDRWDL